MRSADERQVEVLVAAHEIKAGDTFAEALQDGAVLLATVSESDVRPGADDDPGAFDGLVAVEDIEEGEQLTPDNMKDAESLTATLPIPDGMIAISVGVTNPPDSIRPGDVVEFMVSDGETQRGVLRRSVQVLAAGSTDAGDSLVTVAVDEREAERLRFAEKLADVTHGELTVEVAD